MKEIDRTIFYNLETLGLAMLEEAKGARDWQNAHADKRSMRSDGILKYEIYKKKAEALEIAGKALIDSRIQ